MNAVTEQPSPHTTDAAIQSVLRRILILNLAVAFAKLGMGLATGAISMVADGFHSLIDGMSNVVAIVAQVIAAQPPDAEHPYGHRRFEAIATFIIGGFLLLTAWEVLKAAVGRLVEGGEPEVRAESFGVLLVTLVINALVVWYERRRGRALKSPVLLADAEHTFTDILVTCSVILGLALVQAGFPWADAAIGLVIVLVIARMGWHIIAASIKVLVDAAPLPIDALEHAILTVAPVEKVLLVRSRGAGDDVRVDAEVQVAPETSADHAYNIRDAIQSEVQNRFPSVREVQVTFAPQHNATPDYALRARAAADGLGLSVHEVVAIPSGDGFTLEMHVEVSRGISLANAHEQVSVLEKKLLADTDIENVVTHIEPTSAHGAPISHSHAALGLRDNALHIAEDLYPDANWHNPAIRLALGGYALTMHCNLPGSVSVEEAHQIAEQVETRIRSDLPLIQRVTIHTEPAER